MQIQSSSLLSSPLLSSPRQTPVQNQRQGVKFEEFSHTYITLMLKYLKEGGATSKQLQQVKTALVNLEQTRPDLDAKVRVFIPQPTNIKIILAKDYDAEMYNNIIPSLIQKASEAMGCDSIIKGLFDIAGTLDMGVKAEIPHDQPEKAILILNYLHEIVKKAPNPTEKLSS